MTYTNTKTNSKKKQRQTLIVKPNLPGEVLAVELILIKTYFDNLATIEECLHTANYKMNN